MRMKRGRAKNKEKLAMALAWRCVAFLYMCGVCIYVKFALHSMSTALAEAEA